MNRLFSVFRKSLAPKVIISTLVLCLGVIYVAGSALNSQLSAGIKKVNLQSSIVEANSTIFSAQYRFLLAQGEKNTAVRKVIDDIIASTTSLTTNDNAREVVFLKSPENSRKNRPYRKMAKEWCANPKGRTRQSTPRNWHNRRGAKLLVL